MTAMETARMRLRSFLSPGDSRVMLGRVVWLALVGLVLAVFVVGVPAEYAARQVICTGSSCAEWQMKLTTGSPIPPASAIRAYAGGTIALELIVAVICLGVSMIVFWKGSRQHEALVAALAMATFGFTFSDTGGALAATYAAWKVPVGVLQVVSMPLFMLFFYTFPNGRFVPRWSRWFILPPLVAQAVHVSTPGSMVDSFIQNTAPGTLIWLTMLATLLYSQIYRFRKVSSPVERQQTKWVVSALTFALVGIMIVTLLGLPFPALYQPQSGAFLFASALQSSFLICIPIGVAAAVTRYHLWDIDRLINHAIVYLALSACLAATYVGAVLLLQHLLNPLTGRSDITVALSTLLVAWLFTPVHHRIQAIVDRRFYRQKYDAEHVLSRFGTTARDEVDLEQLTGVLAAVISETVQPAHLSVWLRNVGVE